MGILRFLADIDSVNKISDKLGAGAAFAYLDVINNIEKNKNNESNGTIIVNNIIENDYQYEDNDEILKAREKIVKLIDELYSTRENILCYEHKKAVEYLKNEVMNVTPYTYSLLEKEINKFNYIMFYFITINDVIIQIKEQVNNFSDEDVSKENKIKVNKLIDEIMKSTLEEESRFNIEKLVNFLLEIGADVRNDIENVYLQIEEGRKQIGYNDC
jgi:hypothetical protein